MDLLADIASKNRGFAAVIAALALSLCGVSHASADALYDQTIGLPGGFLAGGVGADDFTIPLGPPWLVQSVHVDGQGGAGSKFEWDIELADQLSSEAFVGPTSVGSSNQVSTPLSGADSFDIPFEPRYPLAGVALQPGHYWLSVSARSFASPTKPPGLPWAWQTQSPVTGYEAVWLEKACYGQTAAWKPLSACGKVGPDFRFRVDGVPMDASLSKVKLVKQIRRPAGGVTLVVEVPVVGTLVARKTSGKGQVNVDLSQLFPTDDGYVAAVKVKPKGPTKAALKQGAKLPTKVAVTYTPTAYNGVTGVVATKNFNVLLKKVPGTKP